MGPLRFTAIGYLTVSAIPYESPLITRVSRIKKKVCASAIFSSVIGRRRGSSVAVAGMDVGNSTITVGGGGKSFGVGGTDLQAASKNTMNKNDFFNPAPRSEVVRVPRS